MDKLDALKIVCQYINTKYIENNNFKINALNLFEEKIIEIKKEFDLIINVYNKKLINNNLLLKYKFLFKQIEPSDINYNYNYNIFKGIYECILFILKIINIIKFKNLNKKNLINILNNEIANLLLININDLLKERYDFAETKYNYLNYKKNYEKNLNNTNLNEKLNNIFKDELNNFYNVIGYKKIINNNFLQIKQYDILELYIRYIENEYFNILWSYRTYNSLNTNNSNIEEYFKNILHKEILIKDYNETLNKYEATFKLFYHKGFYIKFIGIFGCLRFILEIFDICNIKSNIIVNYSNSSTDEDENKSVNEDEDENVNESVNEDEYIVLPSNIIKYIKKKRTLEELKQQQKDMLDYEIDRLFNLDLCIDT